MAHVKLDNPEPFNFKKPEDWQRWKRRYEQFRVASGLKEASASKQVSTLLYCMGEKSEVVLSSTNPTEDERKTHDAVSILRHVPALVRLLQHHLRAISTQGQEVLLYENQALKPRYFLAIGVVSGVQLVLWIYLSYFALTGLEFDEKPTKSGAATRAADGSASNVNPPVAPPSRDRFWTLSPKWRAFFSTLALGTGVFFAATACLYPLRMIAKLYYLPPVSALRLHTYTPLGTARAVQIPLTRVFCSGGRTSDRTHVALKAQGYLMYFLVDKNQGRFLDSRTFDIVVGSRRRM